MKISDFLNPDLILPELSARTKEEVLTELADRIARNFPRVSAEKLIQILKDREKLGSTGIGDGFAIPHGKSKSIDQMIISFGRSRAGIPFDSMDGKPAYYFFVLIAPENSAGDHLKALAKISRFFKNSLFKESLAKAEGQAELQKLIQDQDDLTL
ncbi:MAG TPA: PTS sugar transporter subunit IIA [Desulfatirhabdiaceae bacterium]|nr:PTS sugar transporter subunit IIA [Desulfatirhabdiaceae bacterium]